MITLTPAERSRGDFLRALSDDTRRVIFSAIVMGGGKMSVSDLVDELAIKQPKVSHHLAILRQSQLIVGERVGRRIYYKLNYSRCGLVNFESSNPIVIVFDRGGMTLLSLPLEV